MTTSGENNIKTANDNHEENQEELQLSYTNGKLEEELANDAQNSLDPENGDSPTYLYDQEQNGGKFRILL